MNYKRLISFKIFVILIFLIIFIRLIFLCVVKKEYYLSQYFKSTNRIVYGENKERGRILDTNGIVLVDNKLVKRITYTKSKDIKREDEIKIAYKLANLISIDKEADELLLRKFYLLLNKDYSNNLISDLEYRLYEERKISSSDLYNYKINRVTSKDLKSLTDKDKRAAYIYYLMNKGYSYEKKSIKDENVTDLEYAKVSEANIKGVTTDYTWERYYLYEDTLRSIFGNVSDNGIPSDLKDYYLNLGYELDDRVGVSYLELQYDKLLRGTKDEYVLNNDNTLTLLKEGTKGKDLVLSIDIKLQQFVDETLKEQIEKSKKERNTQYYTGSYVIISNPNNGNILAFSGWKYIDKGIFSEVSINNALSSFTLGSVVKGASISVGYINSVIDINTTVRDSCVKLDNIPEKCSYKRLGKINDIKALAYSSNYYQFLIAIGVTGNKYVKNMKLYATLDDFNKYRNVFRSYGLGTYTGIDIPNEKLGVTGKEVADDLILNFAIGQYDTYTPVMLMQYINTIATNGTKHSLSLKKTDKGKILGKVNMEQKYFDRIKEGLSAVINTGTGRGYANKKYDAAGKTGTSESTIDGVSTVSKSFALFMPKDNPQISMIIISPNLRYSNNKSEYTSPINRRVSSIISKKMFEYLK